MKATTPIPLRDSTEPRSAAGLFVEADTGRVVANLKLDLEAAGVTVEEIVRRYALGVPSADRMARARGALERLLTGISDLDDLKVLVEALYFAGHQRLLAKHHIRFPAYDILDEYFTNVTAPWGTDVLPRPRVQGRSWSLFGRRIGFPIGVPASVLTANAKWIHYFASNGFNVLTYKTVRSRAWAPYERPNWAFVPDARKPFPLDRSEFTVHADPWDWVDPGTRDVTTTNSFGVPSLEPHEWMADLEKALTVLADDQLLIVSVMGDHYGAGQPRLQDIATDFARTAKLAEQAGAEIIELNLSSPNSLDSESRGVKPPLCMDVGVAEQIVKEVRDALDGRTQLVAKLSYLGEQPLADLVNRIAPFVDGISGINTLQCVVRRTDDSPTFPRRQRAGVSGIAIRDYARDFVARLARLRAECGSYFEILGMGGVTDPSSFQDLYALGASAVQTATGAFANPLLASECVTALGSSLPETPAIIDPDLKMALRTAIIEAAADREITPYEVAALLPIRPSQTFDVFDSLVSDGELAASKETGFYHKTKLKNTAI